MTEETIADLNAKRLCHHCVGEAYLSAEIEAKGKRRKCSYCGTTVKAFQVGEVAGRSMRQHDGVAHPQAR